MATSYVSKLSVGDRATVDQDLSAVGTVTAVQFRGSQVPLYEVSYARGGEVRTSWVEEWRLTRAPSRSSGPSD